MSPSRVPRYYGRRQLEDAGPRRTNSSSSSSSSAAPPPSMMDKNNNNGVHVDSSSIAITGLVLLSVLFFVGFFSIYARRYCSTEFTPRHPPRRSRLTRAVPRFISSVPLGLDPASIRALPLLTYNAPKDTAGRCGCGCVVCLGEFEDGEVVKAIPCCAHLFHPECIDMWLLAHASCPICRSTDLFSAKPELRVEEEGVAPPSASPEVVVVVDGGEEGGGATQRGQEEGGGIGTSRSCCSLVPMEGKCDKPGRSCSL